MILNQKLAESGQHELMLIFIVYFLIFMAIAIKYRGTYIPAYLL